MQTTDIFDKIIVQEKEALAFGFYWESMDQLLEQIRSECDEIKEAWDKQDQSHLKEELGDLISAAVSLCIFCKMDPSQTLQGSTEKFQKRYDALVALTEQDGHKNLKNQPLSVLLSYWEKAKEVAG